MRIWLACVLAAGAASGNDAFPGRYCMPCHGQSAKAGGFVLDGVSAADPAARPEIWERVIKKLRTRDMPPPGAPRADDAVSAGFIAHLTSSLDTAARRTPYAGRPGVRRLNRAQYANAIRDLLSIDLPLAAELPDDQSAAGFDNIASALSMSPLLLEQYLRVARRVSELATGTSEPSPVVEIYRARGTQAAWQGEGMPFGTRGGIRVAHHFPHTGEYEIRAFLVKESLTPLEGVRFFRHRTRIGAGPHTVIATFPDEYAEREGPVQDVGGPGGRPHGGPLDVLGTAVRPAIEFHLDGRRAKRFEISGMTAGEAAFDGQPGPPTLARLEIAGPYGDVSVGETPSRAAIFTCGPASEGGESACAARILGRLARRAFRRDVTTAELQQLTRVFAAARKSKGFEPAIAAALREILLSPDFLFRLEFDPPDGEPGSARPVTSFELASRLSFFLWNSIPDEALLDAAAAGKLRQPATLEHEVRRMLADRRSNALLDDFAAQWLGLRGLAAAAPDKEAFPEFDAGLTAAFQAETRLFVGSVIRENRPVIDLLKARYTYLDERLARHYGIPGIVGPGFRRVPLDAHPQRGGLLGHGSVLLLTSHATRTSPVLRGKWILDNLLNSPPPAPPANVPPLEEAEKGAAKKLTAREQVEKHRANPACASCHARIDPLGFALENYDVLGRWRTRDTGGEIDASGTLATGEQFRGLDGLRTVLTAQSAEFEQAVTERLLTYALGRELGPRDQPAVRDIMRQTEAGGRRFHDLILAIVRSVPFQMRQKQER